MWLKCRTQICHIRISIVLVNPQWIIHHQHLYRLETDQIPIQWVMTICVYHSNNVEFIVILINSVIVKGICFYYLCGWEEDQVSKTTLNPLTFHCEYLELYVIMFSCLFYSQVYCPILRLFMYIYLLICADW